MSPAERRNFFFNVGDGVLATELLFDFREGGGVTDLGLLIDLLFVGQLSDSVFMSSELLGSTTTSLGGRSLSSVCSPKVV